ncbi:MAG: hypothetical protein HKN36_11335 [Hellea sp.]|nr:hypothetical protein [Hellea sp.]
MSIGLVGWAPTFRSFRIILQTAPNTPRAIAVEPAISFTNIADWTEQKNVIRKNLEQSVYGQYPHEVSLKPVKMFTIGDGRFGQNGLLDIIQFDILNNENDKKHSLNVVIVRPANVDGPVPIILTQNFCPTHNIVQIKGVPVPDNIGFSCVGSGIRSKLMLFIFGRYIVSPPIEDILNEGFALAISYPPEFIPDQSHLGQTVLDNFFSNYSEENRPGALISWAMLNVELANFIDQREQFSDTITWGHSRYGKTALLAAAYSDQIDGVISHQSGTGGASLFRNNAGETFEDIYTLYPHWFGKNAKNYASNEDSLPLDQHALLALIAPRPLLLGNARRDVWSDPEGAFRAAKAINGAYELYGVTGMTATRLDQFIPKDSLAFWIRSGTHGVIKEDWPAFLSFLVFHFKTQ